MRTLDKAEVVVIGGGIMGAAICYYLAKKDIEVVLVEQGELASGTTSSSEGAIALADNNPGVMLDMALKSYQLYKKLVEELPCDFEYREKEYLFLVENEEEWDFMHNRVGDLQNEGIPMQMIDSNELHQREIFLSQNLLGAAVCKWHAMINPVYATIALCRSAKNLGARVWTFSRVEAVETDNENNIQKVATSQGEIETSIVANAAGVWAPEIAKMVGISLPIFPRRGQLVVTESIPSITNGYLTESQYLKTKFGVQEKKTPTQTSLKHGIGFTFAPRDNALIGGSREFVGFDNRTSYEAVTAITKRAIRFLPILKHVHAIRMFAGLRPYTSDHFPIICKVASVHDYYVAAGHEGDGLTLAPITGLLISELITTGKITSMNKKELRKLNLSRFSKGDNMVREDKNLSL